jgi:hypothetical protein
MKKLISPLNLILTPLKQHIGCCVVAPLLLKLLGATALAGTIVANETAEAVFLLLAIPAAVYGILKLEDFWRARHEKSHAMHQDPCDAAHCAHRKRDFRNRYIVNLVVAFALALVMHFAFHDHHHHDREPLPVKYY